MRHEFPLARAVPYSRAHVWHRCSPSRRRVETALLTLHQRATEAARTDGILDDPMAISLHASVDYDFAHFGRTHQATALRALIFDKATREYLDYHPCATVVALAEDCRPVSGASTTAG